MSATWRAAGARLLILLVTALLIAGLAGRAHGADRIVGVSGEGEILAPPDQARVTLGIEARKPELEAARTAVNSGVERVLALARELGIEPSRVSATQVTIRPEYDWDPQQRERRFLGYYVARQVVLDLRDLDKLGTLLERAVDLGVNQLGDPELDSTRRRDLERQALTLAVEDARKNADIVARAAGAQLGPVRTLHTSAAVVAPPLRYQAMEARMASDAGGAETYVTGDLRFTATVQAEYDLLVGSER